MDFTKLHISSTNSKPVCENDNFTLVRINIKSKKKITDILDSNMNFEYLQILNPALDDFSSIFTKQGKIGIFI